MIKEIFVSLKDNFKEKDKNPFIGTYIGVWFIRNWDLVYTLFNFNDGESLEIKVKFIEDYYKDNDFIYGILHNLWITLVVLILTYIILNLSRVITNVSEKQIKPQIYKYTDSKSIVLKGTHNAVKLERDSLLLRLEKERDSKAKLETQVIELEKQNKILENQIASYKFVNKENEQPKSKNEIEIIQQKLIDMKLLDTFEKYAISIKKGNALPRNNEAINQFIKFNLISFLHNYDNFAKYAIAPRGQQLFDKINLS